MRKSQFLKENKEVIAQIAQEDSDFAALVDEFKRVSASVKNCSEYTNSVELKKRKCFLKDKILTAILSYEQEVESTTSC